MLEGLKKNSFEIRHSSFRVICQNTGIKKTCQNKWLELTSSSFFSIFEAQNLIMNPSDQRTTEGSNRKTVNKSYYAS